MSLNFVPKLPTWNLAVTPWIFNPATRTRTESDAFMGQLYPPFRSSDNQGPSDAYLVYPFEVTTLHDPKEYNDAGEDAIVFTWNGKTYGFAVIQLLPRWANFPNEHHLALLRRLTALELAGIAAAPAPGLTLPTPITIYHAHEGVNGVSLSGTTNAQIYYQDLTHHADTATSVYCLLSSADFMIVHDYGWYSEETPQGVDIIEAEWPTGSGRLMRWQVGTCEPRRLGFADEHIAICMQPLNATELLLWFTEPDPGTSSIVVSPTTIINDDTMTADITVTYLDAGSSPLVGIPVHISSATAAGTIDAPNGVTDSSGEYTTTYHSDTVETTNFETDLIGPSNDLDVIELPDITGTLSLTVSGTTDGTCTSCSEFDGTIDLFFVSTNLWAGSPIPATCDPGGNYFYFATRTGAGLVTVYFEETTAGHMAQWEALDPLWDGSYPLTLNFVTGTGFCTWPSTVSLIEV